MKAYMSNKNLTKLTEAEINKLSNYFVLLGIKIDSPDFKKLFELGYALLCHSNTVQAVRPINITKFYYNYKEMTLPEIRNMIELSLS